MNRILGVVFSAMLMLSVVLVGGLAVEPVGAAVAGTACKTVTGKATFSPALPKIGATTKVVSTVFVSGAKLGGCVGGGVTSGSVGLTAKFTKPGNCATLASASVSNPTKGKETITWNNRKSSTVAITLTGVKGKAPQAAVSGTVTAGLFKGLKQSGTLNYTVPAGACTKTGLSTVTFKEVTGQAIKPAPVPLRSSVACSKVNAPPLKSGKLTSTFSVCTPPTLSAGGTSLVKPGTGSTSGKLVMTIAWKNGKGTTAATVNYAPVKTKGKCAGATSRVSITGTVTNATGAAAKITKKGEPVKGSVCAVTTGATQGMTVIEPGTKFTL